MRLWSTTLALLPPIVSAQKIALVLSGGGAKGAFEVGALQALCAEPSGSGWNGWSLITGTSIGALNGAGLAQFAVSEQCSRGGGVDFITSFWRAIESTEDVFKTSLGGKCMAGGLAASASMMAGFLLTGGMCDPAPGIGHFRAKVDIEKIKASDVTLNVVATRVDSGEAEWWSDQDDDILEGTLASGAIAPLLYPYMIGQQVYVDGGILHNTPLIRALELGANKAIVVLTGDPFDTQVGIKHFPKGHMAGVEILELYARILVRRNFLNAELMSACTRFPSASIIGLMPTTPLHVGVMDFTNATITELIAKGRADTRALIRDRKSVV